MAYGKWKVASQYIGDKKMYAAYRIRNIDEVDHSGNREYSGGWVENRETVQAVVDYLNGKEGQA